MYNKANNTQVDYIVSTLAHGNDVKAPAEGGARPPPPGFPPPPPPTSNDPYHKYTT